MSRHETIVRLRHMVSHASEAVELLGEKTPEALADDRVLSLALVRLLEVVGEAANRIPRDVQAQYPRIPWSQIISLRNRVIHGYDSVDLDIVWVIITQDLPLLINALNGILDDLETGPHDASRA